jgi:uncharacterized protein YcaQ
MCFWSCGGDLACASTDRRSRIRRSRCDASAAARALRLGGGAHDDLADVDLGRLGERPRDRLRDGPGLHRDRGHLLAQLRTERLYDLAARVLPAELLDQPPVPEEEAQRELVRIAARALGIATMRDLADYFRMTRTDTRDRVGELQQAGELVAVAVEGWTEPAYLVPGAAATGACTVAVAGTRALLSPFDSLIWTRDRTQRLFDFAYHVEIYTPAAKREYGYYVLPFLLDDRLVARVDLKADRAGGRLLVQGAFREPDCDLDEVGPALARELRAVGSWLGLTEVTVGERGDLVGPLERELG